MKSEVKMLQSWSHRNKIREVKEVGENSESPDGPPKNLKKTTSAKIFKGSDLEMSSSSTNLKVRDDITYRKKSL